VVKVPGYSYTDFCRGIVERDGPGCWVKALLETRRAERAVDYPPGLLECRDEFDGMHLITKDRIKRHGPYDVACTLGEILSDPRLGVWGCRRHHGLVDGRLIVLRRAEVPAHVEEVAAELGLEWCLDRDFGAVPPASGGRERP
jgi:hypothetical protein